MLRSVYASTLHFRSRKLVSILHLTSTYHPHLSLNNFRSMANSAAHAERFYADRSAPLCGMEAGKSFAQLRFRGLSQISKLCRLTSHTYLSSPKEKKYAHYLTLASWAGARVIQGQWTPQAQSLYDLLILTFSKDGKLGDLPGLQQKSGLSDDEWEDLLQYTIQVRTLYSLSQIVQLLISLYCRS